MNIHLISIGNRMPRWVVEGYSEYARRLPAECSLQLVEIPPGRRSKGANIPRILEEEGERMLKAIPKHCGVDPKVLPRLVWSGRRGVGPCPI